MSRMTTNVKLLLLFLILLAVVSLGKLYTYDADFFYHEKTRSYLGWFWCEKEGCFFEWAWDPIRNIPNIFYINLHLRQTNERRGGSGYSSKEVKALLLAMDEDMVLSESVFSLYNPFPIKFPENTKGLGYDVYGAIEFSVDDDTLKKVREEGFRVRIIWPPLSDEYLIAASEDIPALLAFSRK